MTDTTESPEAAAKSKPAAIKPAKPTFRIPRQADGPLHYGRLKLAPSARVERFADLPAGVRPEKLLDPSFWKHFAREIVATDRIEAVAEDGAWECDYRVMFVGPEGVHLSAITHGQGDGVTWHGKVEAAAKSSLYKVEWKGTGAKWCVVSTVDGTIIKDKLHPESQAVAYLQKHLERMK